ncbi:hypothetical protein ACTXT7_002401 [Hymenolepis weldensis]
MEIGVLKPRISTWLELKLAPLYLKDLQGFSYLKPRYESGLTDGCLRTFALRIRTVHLPPGDTLIHAGGLLTTLYFVEQGSLEVLDPSDGAILAVLSKGDFFGGLPPLHQPQSLKSRGSRGLPPGLAPRSLVVAKSRFVVRALTYCDLHYVERDEFAALLLSYPEFVENLVSHFELTVPLAGSGPYFTEAWEGIRKPL